MPLENIDTFLKSLITEGVSDLHFKIGRPPLCRRYGALEPGGHPPLTGPDVEQLARHLLGADGWEELARKGEKEGSYGIAGFSRLRFSAFRQRGTVAMVMRAIPYHIPTLEELRVPAVVRDLALSSRGLILITGVTGSGKSSTLAAMVDHINQTKPCHVVTLEDPVEFLHRDSLASINQREIGVDTEGFAQALKAVLRQDPDVILVGEMRDAETMQTALSAAESGHLVLSTMHTADAKETLGRIIDSFPAHKEKQIRLQLANNLRAVVSQRLVERADCQGRVLAAEVMVVNAAVRGYILEPGKTMDIVENMSKGRDQYGSVTFDQTLFDLCKDGLVSREEALRQASSANDLKLTLHREGLSE